MLPMLRGEVEEREQLVLIPRERLERLRVLGPVFLGEVGDGLLGRLPALGIHDLAQRLLALGWSRFGSLSSTLARRCTQQRCSRVSGHTSRTAAQNPSAPSPTASTGALMPRRLRS